MTVDTQRYHPHISPADKEPTTMYQPDQPDPAAQPPPAAPPSPRRGRGLLIAAIVLGVIAAAGIGTTATLLLTRGDDAAEQPAADSEPSTAVEPAADEPEPEPVPADPGTDQIFLSAKVLSKECFGSAGCLVDFRIEVVYLGSEIDPDVTYEVTYEVTGGEDPVVNTLELTGDIATVEESENIDTPSSDAELEVEVIDLSALDW